MSLAYSGHRVDILVEFEAIQSCRLPRPIQPCNKKKEWLITKHLLILCLCNEQVNLTVFKNGGSIATYHTYHDRVRTPWTMGGTLFKKAAIDLPIMTTT
jgi:hypothetical protein